MRAIAIAEDRRHYTGLSGYLSSRDPAVRLRALRAAGRLQDSTTVKDLLPLLRDPDREVRREAAFALGQIGHRSARGALEGLLAGDDVELVDLAIEALGKIGDHASTPRVASYLGNPSPLLRGEAAVALWRLADSTALEGLLERHNDLNAEVRWRVLYALEKIVAPDRVVPAVTPHLDFVRDVPEDQGGKVMLGWKASSFDGFPGKVTSYRVKLKVSFKYLPEAAPSRKGASRKR